MGKIHKQLCEFDESEDKPRARFIDRVDTHGVWTVSNMDELYSNVSLSNLQQLSLTRWFLCKCGPKSMNTSYPALQVLHLDNTVFKQTYSKERVERDEGDTWFTMAKILRDEYKGLCKLEFGDGPFFRLKVP
jgi:hypothetical protein